MFIQEKPTVVNIDDVNDTLEITYKVFNFHGNTNLSLSSSPPSPYSVYKIIYSCKDGKFHKSAPIYGKIIPQQNERYEFE